jgi:integrase/recombinase XerD
VCPGTRRNYVRFVRAFLQSGTDLAVIVVWPRHFSPAATHQYLEADLAAKEAVLQRLADPSPTPTRFHPGDRLLAFLQDL